MVNNDHNLAEAMHKIHVHQLTVNEAAEHYDVSIDTIYQALRQRHIAMDKKKRALLIAHYAGS